MDKGREAAIIAEFGNNLRKIRKERKMSTWDLADRADLDYGNINEIENGKISPTALTIVKLAEALGIHPGDLFGNK